MQSKRKIIIALVAMLFLINSGTSLAWDEKSVFGDPGLDMIVDFAVARPLGIAATAVGCVFFVASLPFTIWTKERLNKAGHNLVVVPGHYAFVRPLGDFQNAQ